MALSIPSTNPLPVYHIHDQPVPANGTCAGTLAHHDPYKRPEKPPCDPSKLQTCQVGDLSGKYGDIASDPFTASYVDLYESTKPGIGAFFGNRSITFHYFNTTRITCANFTLAAPEHQAPNATTTVVSGGNYTSPTTPAVDSSVVAFTGAAARNVVASASVVVSAVVAAFFL